jgi:hypothetical protein
VGTHWAHQNSKHPNQCWAIILIFQRIIGFGYFKKIEFQEPIGSRYLKKIESKNQWF